MYSFQANAGRKKNKQLVRLLYVIIFILIVALVGVTVSYLRTQGVGEATSEALKARVVSEATEAQSAVYRLTQSSGTNTMTLLSTVRSHIYALQSLNTLTANIYGPGTVLTDSDQLAACTSMLDQCDTRIQAGSVLTDLTTQLRDQIDAIVEGFQLIQQ